MADNSKPKGSNGNSRNDGLGEVSADAFRAAPLMMTADELAETLCIFKRQVWRLKARGDIPKPVTSSTSVRWRRSDILDWIAEGCPAKSSLTHRPILLPSSRHSTRRPTFAGNAEP